MTESIEDVVARRPRTERLDRVGLWIRRAAMCALLAVVVVALCNVVGQRSSTATAANGAVTLSVRVPHAVRAGLLYQGRIAITAHQQLPAVNLVLAHGWIDGLTMNTAEPSASTETSGPGGSLIFSLGPLKQGQTFVEYLEFQVNPTSYSGRHLFTSVTSGGTQVAALDRTMMIFP